MWPELALIAVPASSMQAAAVTTPGAPYVPSKVEVIFEDPVPVRPERLIAQGHRQ